jgi:hypothetical protein
MLDSSPFCRNCGATLPEKQARYCHSCGQTTHLEIPTFAEFVHELVGHYVALEGKLATTLRALLFSPGKLTRDYFDGRRQRHIPPLRLYLTFSLIFFVVFKLAVSVPVAVPQTSSTAPTTVAAEAPAANPGASPTRESFKKAIVAYGAYAMFFLIPIFTMFLRVLYPRRQLNFGSHLVFSFHVHTFFFIAFAIAALLPAGPWLVVGLFVICGTYLQMAMQAVYGGRVYFNLMRLLALFVIYAFCMAVTTAGIAGWVGARAAA